MTNAGIFKGELADDSPQLNALLRRQCKPDELEHLKRVFRHVVLHRGCEEPVGREPGVSYNPRPARVCCLLIQEGKIRHTPLLAAALLSSLHDEEIVRSSAEFDRSLIEDARAVSQRSFPCDPRLEPLYVAHDLDILRHAHMSAEISDVVSTVIAGVADRARRYSLRDSRLFHLLGHALARFAS